MKAITSKAKADSRKRHFLSTMGALSTLNKERRFIEKQQMFFIASAPLSAKHHVNVSPKSMTEFRVIDDQRVAYIDLTGSGSETTAHVLENGRVTVMFCSFEATPKILRLYGQGQIVLPNELMSESSEMSSIRMAFQIEDVEAWEKLPAPRSVVVVHVSRVSTSCGWAVPIYEFVRPRNTLCEKLAANVARDPDAVALYQREANAFSIDGLRSLGKLQEEELPAHMRARSNVLKEFILKTWFKLSRLSTSANAQFYQVVAAFILGGCSYAGILRLWRRLTG